jgi:hypothetical protein
MPEGFQGKTALYLWTLSGVVEEEVYLPRQNLENICSRISSVAVSPVISPR